MKVKSESEVTQSCPTLSNPMDCSLPGSAIHGIFQARVLEWGAIAFSIYSYWTSPKQRNCQSVSFGLGILVLVWNAFRNSQTLRLGLDFGLELPKEIKSVNVSIVSPSICHEVMGLAMAPHSSTLAWKIPWMAEPGRLQFMGSLLNVQKTKIMASSPIYC